VTGGAHFAPLCLAFAALMLGCAPSPKDVPAPASATPTVPSAPATPPPDAGLAPPPARLSPDWAAIRTAETACEDCHPDQTSAWRQSPMGRSLTPYGGAHPSVERLEPPRARVLHERSTQNFKARFDDTNRPIFTLEVAGETFERAASYIVGSGSHTRSYFWTEGDALFEAPLTWYRRRAGWALSPGYDTPDQPGMHREIGEDCLFCHADPAPHHAGSANRFGAPPPAAIGCSRCHGDPQAHVAARSSGRTAPEGVLVRPSRLAPVRAAEVCDQCHLQGAVRVVRDGHAFGEYLPGGALTDSVVTFIRSAAGTEVGIASHGERLRRTRCGDGRLGCTDCHDPHGRAPADRSASCRTCHGENHQTCKGGGGRDCVQCHMPRTDTSDIPHVAMTDHFIRVVEAKANAPTPKSDSAGDLVRIGERPASMTDGEASLLLGRAYAEAARMGGPNVQQDRLRALEHLQRGLAALPNSAAGHADLASVFQSQGNTEGLSQSIERAFTLRPADVRIARATASARLSSGNPKGALEATRRGLSADPGSVPLLVQQGQAHVALGQRAEARQAFDRARALRPLDPDLTLAEGILAEFSGDPTGARRQYDRATRLAPLHLGAWLNAARAAAEADDWKASLIALDRARAALKDRGPVPPSVLQKLDAGRALALARTGRGEEAAKLALQLVESGARESDAALTLAHLALTTGRIEPALDFLDRAVTWAPESVVAWRMLSTALQARGDLPNAERARQQARRLRPGAALP